MVKFLSNATRKNATDTGIMDMSLDTLTLPDGLNLTRQIMFIFGKHRNYIFKHEKINYRIFVKHIDGVMNFEWCPSGGKMTIYEIHTIADLIKFIEAHYGGSGYDTFVNKLNAVVDTFIEMYISAQNE